MTAPPNVDAYIAALSVERRAGIEAMRESINAAAPEATETIAYAMPALRSHGGQFLVSYAAYKRHYSLFPASGRGHRGTRRGAHAVPVGPGNDPVPGGPAHPDRARHEDRGDPPRRKRGASPGLIQPGRRRAL